MIGPRAVVDTGAVIDQALVLPEAVLDADSDTTGILGDVEGLDGVWLR